MKTKRQIHWARMVQQLRRNDTTALEVFLESLRSARRSVPRSTTIVLPSPTHQNQSEYLAMIIITN